MSNGNGAVFSLSLEQYSNNINYTEQQVDPEMNQITSLDLWVPIQEATDENGKAELFYVTEFGGEASTPQFGAMVYTDSGRIREVRLDWDSANALASATTFREYAIVQIMSVSDLDAETAGKMFDAVKSAAYTNGVSTQLAYGYNKSIRCYYMINAGYHIVVVEPFSLESKTKEEATGRFIYTEVLPGGVANAGGTAVPAATGAAEAPDASGSVSGSTGNVPVTSGGE